MFVAYSFHLWYRQLHTLNVCAACKYHPILNLPRILESIPYLWSPIIIDKSLFCASFSFQDRRFMLSLSWEQRRSLIFLVKYSCFMACLDLFFFLKTVKVLERLSYCPAPCLDCFYRTCIGYTFLQILLFIKPTSFAFEAASLCQLVIFQPSKSTSWVLITFDGGKRWNCLTAACWKPVVELEMTE